MSRIVGVISEDNCFAQSTIEKMCSALPGNVVNKESFKSGVFSWKCFKKNNSGAVGSFKNIYLALDGRILNVDELGGKSSNIPELLIKLYLDIGFSELLKRVIGDFAISLYDENTKVLWLGRDRLGVKPLYYVYKNGNLGFSSQPKALLNMSGVTKELNHSYVARYAGLHYRTFDNEFNASPYQDVHQLPAGHYVSLNSKEKIKSIRYWELQESTDLDVPIEELSDIYQEKLLQSVSRRLKYSGKSTFTLSGGLDSSSVLCCAVDITKEKQHAFSSVYEDSTYDERDEIKDVVKDKVSEWHAIEIPNQIELYDIVTEMVKIHEEPVATATWLSHYILTQEVADLGFDSLFGGLGGDELNAGEYEYFPMHFADLLNAGRLDDLNEEIQYWAEYHDHPIFQKNHDIAKLLIDKMTDQNRPGVCLPDKDRMLKYAHVVNSDFFELISYEPIMDSPFKSYLKNRTYQDMIRETLPCCLRAEDRQCVAMGLEHFDPFLDHELIEFMYRIPGDLKIKHGVTKQLLRKAMNGILPDETRNRIKKTGWNAPAHQWFYGKNIEMLKDLVVSKKFNDMGIYSQDAVLNIIDEHVDIINNNNNKENHMMFLWQTLNLVLWVDTI